MKPKTPQEWLACKPLADANLPAWILDIQLDAILSRGNNSAEESKPEPPKPWPLTPGRQRCAIVNAHRLLHRQYKGVVLWSFIADITSHGSGYSIEICKQLGWNPDQDGSLPIH